MTGNDFHKTLEKYINGGSMTFMDKLIYFISSRFVFKKNAAAIQSYFQEIKEKEAGAPHHVAIKVNPYNGLNKSVSDLKEYLEKNVKEYLAGAYVHGSIGTGEEINYSDFDAMVILKDEIFDDREKLSKAAALLNSARKIMFRMDPLQHHGWFVIAENDLRNYPETYFPHKLFEYSKSLFSDRGLELKITTYQDTTDYVLPLRNLCAGIERDLDKGLYPGNAYKLKSLLSRFMLLPSLYVQARDKECVYKKFSFEKAKTDFSANEWKIMDDVSSLRKNWNVHVNGWRRSMIASPAFFSFNLARRLSPSVPEKIRKQLNREFYQSMLEFTKLTGQKIK